MSDVFESMSGIIILLALVVVGIGIFVVRHKKS